MAPSEIAEGRASRDHPIPKVQELVMTLSGFGLTVDQIALVLTVQGYKISKRTLLRYYAEDHAAGTVVASVKVAQNLYTLATTPDPKCIPAAIFWLKTRARWREQTPTVINPDEPSITIQHVIDDRRTIRDQIVAFVEHHKEKAIPQEVQ